MKVGLFVCDHVTPELQTEFGDYPKMFADLFPEYEIVPFYCVDGEFPSDLHVCDWYMCTGARYSVYEDRPWILQLKDSLRALRNLDIGFIGFCFGHQLLAEALGGRVVKSENGWCIGVYEFTIDNEQAWMHPAASSINLLMMCQDQVTQLPAGSVHLAVNANCEIGIFQVGNKMLGIQAHPEYSKAFDRILMEKRKPKIGAEKVKEGLLSLDQEVHRSLIRSWIINFIEK